MSVTSLPTAEEPRELKEGRRKDHVVVRFDPPAGRRLGHTPEPEWQVFDQAEA